MRLSRTEPVVYSASACDTRACLCSSVSPFGRRLRAKIVDRDRELLERRGEATEPTAGENRQPGLHIRASQIRKQLLRLCNRPSECALNAFANSVAFAAHAV